MKIIITEDQARRLNILNPNANPISKMEQTTKLRNDELDKMFNELTNLSISEIIAPGFNLELGESLQKIEDEINGLIEDSYNYTSTLGDREGRELNAKMEHDSDITKNKIDSLGIIVDKINQLKDLVEDNELLKHFQGQEPLDITNYQ